jgi:hypothetical protein
VSARCHQQRHLPRCQLVVRRNHITGTHNRAKTISGDLKSYIPLLRRVEEALPRSSSLKRCGNFDMVANSVIIETLQRLQNSVITYRQTGETRQKDSRQRDGQTGNKTRTDTHRPTPSNQLSTTVPRSNPSSTASRPINTKLAHSLTHSPTHAS